MDVQCERTLAYRICAQPLTCNISYFPYDTYAADAKGIDPVRHRPSCRNGGTGMEVTMNSVAIVLFPCSMGVARFGLKPSWLDLPSLCWYPVAPSRVAQLVEQLTVNQRVAGSSPAGGAN